MNNKDAEVTDNVEIPVKEESPTEVVEKEEIDELVEEPEVEEEQDFSKTFQKLNDKLQLVRKDETKQQAYYTQYDEKLPHSKDNYNKEIEALEIEKRRCEIKKEKQKGTHRNIILIGTMIFLIIQITFMNLIVALVILNQKVKIEWLKDLQDESLNLIFSFFKFYVTAIIAELIGAMLFITKKLW